MAQPLLRSDLELVDFADPESLLSYAKKLEGHTFQDVLDLGILPGGAEKGVREAAGKAEYGAALFKGGLGTLIEERYFGYKANDNPAPDFEEAGVELKTTCYDTTKKGEKRAGERLVLCMIAFDESIEEPLEQSHVWAKGGNILLIYYGRNKAIEKYDQEISYVVLFTPPEKDLVIIREDYAKIQRYIMEGRADELSESMTNYLGACTKGATAEKSMRDQKVYAPGRQARGRAWCYKVSYMNAVLNEYIIGGQLPEPGKVSERHKKEKTGVEIVKNADLLKEIGFDRYVLSLVEPYIGMTDREIGAALGLEYSGNKAQWTTLTYHMLGIKGNHAEEFVKANVSVRAVRIEADGRVRESMSLAPFRFSNLLEETWDTAPLYEYFSETRFFFVAFQDTPKGYTLRGAKFWSMPVSDIEGPLRDCWAEAQEAVRGGVRLVAKTNASGKRVYSNNLPGMSDNPVAHVRPHSSRAAYLLEDGTEIGVIEQDGDMLPDGRWMTKQSFWLNKGYIQDIVSDLAKTSKDDE